MPNKRAVSMRHRLLGAVAVPSLLLIAAATVAGCSGTDSSSAAAASAALPAASASAAGGPTPTAARNGAQNGGAYSVQNGEVSSGTTATYVPAGRQLIYTAQLTVRTADVTSAVSRATSIVSAADGYVSGENTSAGNGKPGQATATVTFKIPAAAYAKTLAALSGGGLGTQLSLSQQAKDVTQQVADVSSRVTSDEAAIAQLRALLKHAGNVSSLLSVQNQINAEESNLESMLAQQKALNQETSYATVTLTLVGPKAAAKPAAKAAPPPGLLRGLSGGWHALRVTVGWLLTIFGATAPFLAVAAFAGGLFWWLRRRPLRRARK